ncbi:MAG: flagellar export protein FliJ [Treponema sp.]|uniref:flagellar export protein FliJ n=1 Tax=Treponema sp. TaxID=166 RepID=UPI001D206703|nr:flagellar export protein FliJ [Treponema sp.]MBS7240962.1 flagellar export protein FliJ [Treponema sp.]
MKKFQFKMQKILDLRKFEQQQAEAELGIANAEVARIQRELDNIAMQKVRTSKANEGQTDFYILTQMERYFVGLDIKKEIFLQKMVQAQMVADEKRAVVLECMKKTKSLEKLRDKHFEAWKKETLRQEEIAVDDVVTAKSHQESS